MPYSREEGAPFRGTEMGFAVSFSPLLGAVPAVSEDGERVEAGVRGYQAWP